MVELVWQLFFVSSSVKTMEFLRINSDLGGSAGLATFFVSSSVKTMEF